MRRVSGGLGFVSERGGVHRHAVTACIAGLVVLLTGCLHDEGVPAPTVVQVVCTNSYDMRRHKLTRYWSDGKITEEVFVNRCP